MKEKDDIRIDFKLWDLVKSSTKKIKSNDYISHFPKKPFLKKEASKSLQNINKIEKISFDKTSNISNKINFIDNSKFLFETSNSELPNNWDIKLKNEYISGCIDIKKDILDDQGLQNRMEFSLYL